MEINKLEKENNIELNNNLVNEVEQKSFLETALGKTINTAIDIGIRAALPDFIEDQIINIKDNLFNYGLKDGITKTIDDAIDLGKSAIGIVTGNFENVSQMQSAVQSGGLIDGISSLLDTAIVQAQKAGVINNTVANALSQGKNVILNNVEKNIEKSFTEQYEAIDNLNTYIENWNNAYNNKDFESMEREYKKIEKALQNIAPIENTINDAKNVEILHNVIKNNGQNFDLTQDELDLARKLNSV